MASGSHGRPSLDSLTSPMSNTTTERGQYPFPRQESQKFQSNTRRTSNNSSIGGMLDATDNSGTDLEVAQNAISTLLQPPIVRTGLVPHSSLPASASYKAPTSRDIPPVTLTTIPHVENSVFRPYISQIGSIFESFQQAKLEQRQEEEELQLQKRSSQIGNESVSGFDKGAGPGRKLSSHPRRSSSISLASPTEGPNRRRSSGGTPKKPPHTLPALSTIPTVYLDPDFHLENPRIFDVVSERSDVIRPISSSFQDSGSAAGVTGRKALATNAILQEKLSWYMDTVEMHLISSISSASTSFFAALGSLRELQQQTSDSVKRIAELRSKLLQLDQNVVEEGLKVVNMKRRRANLQGLGHAVNQVKDIVEAISESDKLISSGDFDGAISTVEETENIIAGHTKVSTPPVHDQIYLDLRGVTALDGVVTDLEGLRYRIGKGFEGQFLDALQDDLRTHVASVQIHETLLRWGLSLLRSRGEHNRKPSSIPAFINIDKQFRTLLATNINGLGRSNYLAAAAAAYREAAIRHIKRLVRKYLPSSNDDDNDSMMSASTHSSRPRSQQEKSSILARNLRSLDPGDAYSLLSHTYTSLGESLRRLSTQIKLLLDITSGVGSPPGSASIRSPMRSPSIGSVDSYLSVKPTSTGGVSPGTVQREMSQALDMSNLLDLAVESAQGGIVRILKVRTEPTINMPLSDFLKYFTLNRLFADECEAISGSSGMALKSIVNNHIKDFVSNYGSSQRQKLMDSMDADLWDAREIRDDEKSALSRVLEGCNRDADTWLRATRIWEAQPLTNGSSGKEKETSSITTSKEVLIDEQKFMLSNSAYAALLGVEEFESLICGIPSMTQEITSTLLEYLRIFNSRASQLILGAGATRKAGLKNITTKHLALASQALSFLTALIPYLREFTRRHSSAFGPLGLEFDKVKRLFQDHQMAIHDKLVDIMSGRAAAHVSALKKIDWEADRTEVNDYMERLAKETGTLQRVLSKHLPETTVSMIMTPIFTNYRENLGRAFAEVKITSEASKERLVRDAEHLKSRLSRLEGSGDVGDYIVRVATNKAVARAPPFVNGQAADVSVAKASTEQTEPAEAVDTKSEVPDATP